jgi:hypothetical protein
LLLAVVAVVAAGCTVTPQVAPSGEASSAPGGGAGGSVSQTVQPGPADRDPAAVMAALRQIDACKLIDQSAVTAAGYPVAFLGVPSPHSCQAFIKASLSELHVRLGGTFELPTRFFAAPLDVAGMRGYRTDMTRSSNGKPEPVCQVDLPVAPQQSISLWVRRDTTGADTFDPCKVAEAVGVSAAAALAHAEQVRADPTDTPLSTWDACTLLLVLLGKHPTKYKLTRGGGLFDNAMDTCSAQQKSNHSLNDDFELRLDYRKADWAAQGIYEHPSDIEGKQVFLRRDSKGNCDRAWVHQPLPNTNGSWVAVIELTSQTCEPEPVSQVIRAERAGPPPVQPLAQLLYRVDQPDLNYPGACVDYGSALQGDCQPAHETTVPTDPEQRRQAADRDPNITCALSAITVRAHLGAGLQPVTSNGACAWVEPTHTVALRIAVRTNRTPESYGTSEQARQITVGGHPALRIDHTADPGHQRWEIYVSTGNDLSQPGVIGAELATYPPRGSRDGTAANTQPSGQLEPIIADLLAVT